MAANSSPPYELLASPYAEAAVLGSMVLDPKRIPSVLSVLTEEQFSSPEHRTIWRAIITLWSSGAGADLDGILLRAELERSRVLEGIGGTAYLEEMLGKVASSANAVYYAKEVAERAKYREAWSAAEKMRAALLEGGKASDVVGEIQKIALSLISKNDGTAVYDVADHAKNIAVATQDSRSLIYTGFPDVDFLMGGTQPGDLVIVAARPSMGKTTFLCEWSLRAAQGGNRVLIFTLEMTAAGLMERLSAELGHVSLHEIKTRSAPQSVLDAFYGGAIELSGLPIVIVERASTIEQMRGVLRQSQQVQPVSLVGVDYIGLMASAGHNRNEQLTTLSRNLKLMAQSEHVPLVVISQLNRECENRDNKRPRMSDLRDSGSLEQDADVVMLLHREDYYRKLSNPGTTVLDGKAEVIIAKSRNGPTGVAELVFLEEQMRLEPLSHSGEPHE